VLSGCRAMREARAERRAARANKSASIVIDGSFNEWPANASTVADANWIYFRVSIEGNTKPLQASDTTLALWIDADDNPASGAQMPAPQVAAALGVDLVVEFSPRDGSGKPTPGVAAYAIDSSGTRSALSHQNLDLAAQPTTAAPTYEVRISRFPSPAAAPGLDQLLQTAGQGRGMFVLIENNKIVGWSDPEAFTLPARAKSKPLSDATPPAKPAGAIRVLTYNVLKNQPEKNPGPFSRMIQVIKPDIMLFQEWTTDSATAQAWFTAVVSGETRWHARAESNDVLIVSAYPISPLTTSSVIAAGSQNPARFISGVVKTPAGDVAVSSVHLKCCGTVGSSEDQKRIAEATAVQSALSSALGTDGSTLRIIAGDMNLVGSTTPLDTIGKGLDFDGSSLAPADTFLLGDSSVYTWTSDSEVFPPGRLDYILYSDAAATVVNSFALDTRRLSPRALASMGLDMTDSAASDHLPVVADFKVR
jgi:endonuclease/exonuclease/phosphatase family metal-dependent hydrolase